MKEGVFMKQTLLGQVQAQIDKLEDLKRQVEDLSKQYSEKIKEINKYEGDWKKGCEHVFYRIQEMSVIPITMGYHCCLCGTYEELQCADNTKRSTSSMMNSRFPHRRFPRKVIPYQTVHPISPKETHEFIGTVITSPYDDGLTDEERYPIPSEYQAEVNHKLSELSSLNAEKESLIKRRDELDAAVETVKKELDTIAHTLNSYFGYPQVVYESPRRWTRGDFNFDEFA